MSMNKKYPTLSKIVKVLSNTGKPFRDAYIEVLLATEAPNKTPEDLSPEVLAQIDKDCREFQNKIRHLGLDMNDVQLGYDFFETRNKIGHAFDEDYPKEHRNFLNKLALSFGEFHVMEGADGKLHL